MQDVDGSKLANQLIFEDSVGHSGPSAVTGALESGGRRRESQCQRDRDENDLTCRSWL